jgi:carbonic anhydrase/acetyltransferase-like protein (isoleucine patch superfamily)
MQFDLGQGRKITRSRNNYIARGAVVVGSVKIGENVGIWFNAVVRGDDDVIEIGDNSNIQDGAVLHTDSGLPLTVGSNVTVGHMAMLHGCTIGENCTIGIKAVVLNRAVIGKNCLIGANALITERTVIPDGSLVVGSPGKVVRALKPDEIDSMRRNTDFYVARIAQYRTELKAVCGEAEYWTV